MRVCNLCNFKFTIIIIVFNNSQCQRKELLKYAPLTNMEEKITTEEKT